MGMASARSDASENSSAMVIGTRRIRSAGRSSGSIEVTLPAQLQLLEGVECRLVVRDGPRPEIVLQPDLSATQRLFGELWQRLRLGLSEAGEIGDFAPADFTLTLFAPRHWQERPPLAFTDALVILRNSEGGAPEQTASSRLFGSLATVAGQRLGLRGALAPAFGDAIAYLTTGVIAGSGADFERGMAHQIFYGAGGATPAPGDALDTGLWRRAAAGLGQVYRQFNLWQAEPAAYTAVRERWYRALTLETGGFAADPA